jgi:hypothetical protein
MDFRHSVKDAFQHGGIDDNGRRVIIGAEFVCDHPHCKRTMRVQNYQQLEYIWLVPTS